MAFDSGAEPGAPKVSVIVPVHNRSALLRRSLRSVANQEFPAGFEIVVADDNSTDDSAAVAEELATTVVRHDHNQGPGAARNSAIAAARGEWIAFLDSDDVWHPLHLQSLWDQRRDVALVGSSGLALSETGLRVEGSPFLHTVELRQPSDVLRPRNVIKTSACMVQAGVLRTVGGFTPGMRYSEDLDLWLRILEGHRGRILPVLTVVTSPHDGQMTLASSPDMRESTRAIVQSDLGVRCLTLELLILRAKAAGFGGVLDGDEGLFER